MSIDFKILDYNYTFQSNTNITATSEATSFPAENAGQEIRAKSWRSSGYFEIDSTNKYIDFKESSGGGELVAILTEGGYSPSTLALEIKTQMESVGAETYTVSFGATTGLWTIAHAGSYLDLLFSTGSNVANSIYSTIGFDNSDYSATITYTAPSIAIHTSEALTIDLATVENINSFYIFFDSIEGINLTEGALIKLQANAAPFWSSPAVDEVLTVDNTYSVITKFFTTSENYRYWRVEIIDPGNSDLYVELGTVVIGQSATMSRVPNNGFKYSLTDNSKVSSNSYGNQYVDVRPQVAMLDFKYNIMEYSDAQTLEDIFRRNGVHTPVVVSWDSAEAIFDKDHFVLYGRMQKKFALNHIVMNYFSGGLKITETY